MLCITLGVLLVSRLTLTFTVTGHSMQAGTDLAGNDGVRSHFLQNAQHGAYASLCAGLGEGLEAFACH